MSARLLTLLVLAASAVEPLAGVVVIPAAEARSGDTGAFVENIRIQLTGLASVTLGPPDASESAHDRAERARLYLSASGATIAVWKEQRTATRTGKRQVVVLAVTRDPKQRPIEVARVDGQAGDEADRVLALKVGELLHQVLASAKSEQELSRALLERETPPAAPERKDSPAPRPPATATAKATRFRGFAEGGLGLRADSRLAGQQVSLRGNLGLSLERLPLRLELAVGARKLTELEFQAESGRLTLSEATAGLELRGLVSLSPLAVGGHGGLAANWVSGSAVAHDGRRGSANKLGTSWTVGPELRLRLVPQLEMRTQVSVETTLYDQRFAIEGRPVEDGSNTRLSGELSLIFWVP